MFSKGYFWNFVALDFTKLNPSLFLILPPYYFNLVKNTWLNLTNSALINLQHTHVKHESNQNSKEVLGYKHTWCFKFGEAWSPLRKNKEYEYLTLTWLLWDDGLECFFNKRISKGETQFFGFYRKHPLPIQNLQSAQEISKEGLHFHFSINEANKSSTHTQTNKNNNTNNKNNNNERTMEWMREWWEEHIL